MRASRSRLRRKPVSPSPDSGGAAGLSEKASQPYSAAPPIVNVIASDRLPNVPAVRATPGALATLRHHGYSDEEIWALVVPKRTLARRVAGKQPLSVEETDRAVRLERIAALAGRVFGNPEKANRWMRKPKHLLGGRTPVDFLETESGARQVEEMLYRIEHGMFA